MGVEDGFPQVAWEFTQALRSADSNLSLRVGSDSEGPSVEPRRGPGFGVSIYVEGGGQRSSSPDPYLSIFSQLSAVLSAHACEMSLLVVQAPSSSWDED